MIQKTALVVDDSATVRQQVGVVLSQAGYRVIEARDGVQGIEQLHHHTVDCVICDVNMPQMNGIEMVRSVKRETAFQSLPIIMLTTEGSTDLILEAKHAGSAGWIVKPFKADLLVAAVDKLTQISTACAPRSVHD